MLKQPGIVAQIDAHLITIDVQPSKSCDTCLTHCGFRSNSGPTQIVVATPQPLAVGDSVSIGIEETALLRAAVRVYLMPLLGLGIAALGYEGLVIFAQLPHHEYFSILSGFLGFWGGWFFFHPSTKNYLFISNEVNK